MTYESPKSRKNPPEGVLDDPGLAFRPVHCIHGVDTMDPEHNCQSVDVENALTELGACRRLLALEIHAHEIGPAIQSAPPDRYRPRGQRLIVSRARTGPGCTYMLETGRSHQWINQDEAVDWLVWASERI
jgi:hypothetical protein